MVYFQHPDSVPGLIGRTARVLQFHGNPTKAVRLWGPGHKILLGEAWETLLQFFQKVLHTHICTNFKNLTLEAAPGHLKRTSPGLGSTLSAQFSFHLLSSSLRQFAWWLQLCSWHMKCKRSTRCPLVASAPLEVAKKYHPELSCSFGCLNAQIIPPPAITSAKDGNVIQHNMSCTVCLCLPGLVYKSTQQASPSCCSMSFTHTSRLSACRARTTQTLPSMLTMSKTNSLSWTSSLNLAVAFWSQSLPWEGYSNYTVTLQAPKGHQTSDTLENLVVVDFCSCSSSTGYWKAPRAAHLAHEQLQDWTTRKTTTCLEWMDVLQSTTESLDGFLTEFALDGTDLGAGDSFQVAKVYIPDV